MFVFAFSALSFSGILQRIMTSLKGHFLIAAASLVESNFHQTVVLMLQHDEHRALGVVINRTMNVTVKQACEQVLETDCDIEGNLHTGGPCEALHDDETLEEDDEAVLPGLHFSTDKDSIEKLLRDPPEHLKFIVGYSGWGAGQLESELKNGSWLVVPATIERVFGPIDGLWTRLISEANLRQWIDPKFIPEDPSQN
jgi:putative transcriptional regulator